MQQLLMEEILHHISSAGHDWVLLMVKPSKYQLGLLVDPTSCMALYISGGAGFLSSTHFIGEKIKSVLASHHITSVVVAIEMPFHLK